HKPSMLDTTQTVASYFFCLLLPFSRVSDCAHCASYRISSAPWEILRAFQRQKSTHTFVNAQTNHAGHDANSGVGFLLSVFAILTCIGLCPLCQLPHLNRISSAPWEILRAFQRQKSTHTFVSAQTNHAGHDANSGVGF